MHSGECTRAGRLIGPDVAVNRSAGSSPALSTVVVADVAKLVDALGSLAGNCAKDKCSMRVRVPPSAINLLGVSR